MAIALKLRHIHLNYALLLASLLCASWCWADSLSVGSPSVSGSRYTFPIYLDNLSSDVAIMDFRFQYDPQVFRPVEAQSGAQAGAANKLVNANQSAPGEYIVVLWGPNQNTINSGEVARIVMEHTGYNAQNTQLGIAGLTMANPDGLQLDSSANALDLNLGSPDTPDDSPDSPKPPDPADDDNGGTDPSAPDEDNGELMENILGAGLGNENFEKPKNTDPTADTKTGDRPTRNFQNSNSSQTLTDPNRLDQLAVNAAALRDALPTPTNSDATEKKDFQNFTKGDTIVAPDTLGKEESGAESLEELGSGTAMAKMAKTGTQGNDLDVGLNADGVDGAPQISNKMYPGWIWYLVGGGILIGLIITITFWAKLSA